MHKRGFVYGIDDIDFAISLKVIFPRSTSHLYKSWMCITFVSYAPPPPKKTQQSEKHKA